jgi:hypothetical protein
MAFEPRDAVETILAGRCVMLHEMMVDSVYVTLRGDDKAARPPNRVGRSSITALDRAFGENLERLERYRARRSNAARTAQAAEIRAEVEGAMRAREAPPPLELAEQPMPDAPAEPAADAVISSAASPASDIAPSPRALDTKSVEPPYLAANNPRLPQTNRPAEPARPQPPRPAPATPAAASGGIVTPNRNAPVTTASAIAAG